MRTSTFLAAVLAAAALAACGGGDSTATDSSFTIAVSGDMPYGATATDTAEFAAYPAYIAAINADKDVSMVLHAGDIHSGKQYCTYDFDAAIYQDWTAFKTPFVYTPGDNEWADCHKAKEGGGTYNPTTGVIDYVMNGTNYVDYAAGDPLANLGLVRSLYFSVPGKTLGAAMTVHTQAQEYDSAHPTDSAFVENVWYEKSGVLFATVNIPGGSNNGSDVWYGAPTMSPQQAQEIVNRTGAALRWLDAVFAKAKANGDKAMVIMVQADLWDLDGKSMSKNHLNKLKQYIDKLANNSVDFGKPVLFINGDSHFYRSDNPLVKGADCKIEIPSATGAKSTATETCVASAGAGALKKDGILVDLNPTTFADAYMTVQDPAQPVTLDANGAVVNPFAATYNVPNFHRLVVHGNAMPAGTDLEYIKLKIDPAVTGTTATESNGVGSFGPFSWIRVQPTLN